MFLKVLSINVEYYTKITKNKNYRVFDDIIKDLDPDILLLQEDIDGDFPDPSVWIRMASCESHEGPIRGQKLRNSVLVKDINSHITSHIKSAKLDTTSTAFDGQYNSSVRCYSSLKYNNISIASVHLYGGRFDDEMYETYSDIRDRQISALIGIDIIGGDFNSNADVNKVPHKHPIYKSLKTDIERQVFQNYFISGHKPLLDKGYLPVPVNSPTDMYGGNPDAIYYNGIKLKLISSEVIDFISKNLSDHNGIFCIFNII